MVDRPDYETHPAYGMVAFNRVQGSPGKMFGSALPQHGHFIRLVVRHGQRKHDLGCDWVMGTGPSVVEAWLSAAQFAELLTTMNIGDGVPCTLIRIEGRKISEMPQDEQTEAERTYEAGEAKMMIFGDELKAEINVMCKKVLAKGALSMTARKEVVRLFDKVLMETEANMPFALRSFQEAVEKTSQHAKAELDAVVLHAITAKGLEALGVKVKQLHGHEIQDPHEFEGEFDHEFEGEFDCDVCGEGRQHYMHNNKEGDDDA